MISYMISYLFQELNSVLANNLIPSQLKTACL